MITINTQIQIILTYLLINSACAFGDSSFLNFTPIDELSKGCNQGLNDAPDEGEFKAYIFCDDGEGTQIAIIADKITGRSSKSWSVDKRIWQEGNWMRDIKSMIWSHGGDYLYVITSEVYSDESLYEIDIVNRKATKLLDGIIIKEYLKIDQIGNEKLIVNGREFRLR